MKKIPFLRPNLVKHGTFLNYLSQIDQSRIYSNYGPLNTLFENRILNEHFGNIGDVTTVNNATTGLMLAISQCKRPNGIYALMPSFTFSATPLAAIWCGLEPYFIDIDPDDWCINEQLINEVLYKLGDKVAVVVPYATFGIHLNIDYYQRLVASGVPVVIDAASSFGNTGKSGHFGKGFLGSVVFSFHATKSFGLGEGGLIYSANKNLIASIRQAGNFGFSMKRETTVQGLNSKMSEYTAAIALSTLDAFPKKAKLRQQIRQWYVNKFNLLNLHNEGWTLQNTDDNIIYQFLPVLCPEGSRNLDYVNLLAHQQIEARTYFSPACHEQSLFQSYSHTALSVTDNIATRILSLPVWEEMDEEDVTHVLRGLIKR
ncbi:DegT/DnrJ/EryC1/StrS family aminotransferase [Aneurinibacillus sp. Ricciae_BoGa-3]|uniref:DegT/DnrJ/EryC1/StrS family aminotransferase n=1 Tax=Aneurinibacillus sp. Ricciae_BoGa-3 TaxID=3022697 RepID=UPI00233F9058|nr:DegT/DnrJ/EryC1/StrS family aminotransferase [Aneurinibacillus sp. Ricciae_BoGa-3]WCK56177.1 DegT/DnrJ/EryC1/StrS family aminotransferase [Aneurinibacillus sp. Ricciae_BoGa-3]